MADPAYLKGLKGEMPIQKTAWFKWYSESFMKTGKFRPVVHVISGVMIIGYTMDFFKHLRRKPLRY